MLLLPERTLTSFLLCLFLLSPLTLGLLLLLPLLGKTTLAFLPLLLFALRFLSALSSEFGFAFLTGLALALLLLPTLLLELLLAFPTLAFTLSLTLLLFGKTLPAFFFLPRLLLLLSLALSFTPGTLLLPLLALFLLKGCLLGLLRGFLSCTLSRPCGALFLLREFLLPVCGFVTERTGRRWGYSPLLVLFLLVLRLLLRVTLLGQLLLVLQFPQQLELALLCDLLAVRLEHALLEHTRREDREHALAFLHFLLLGHGLWRAADVIG